MSETSPQATTEAPQATTEADIAREIRALNEQADALNLRRPSAERAKEIAIRNLAVRLTR
jgi:hypothetical protein